MDLQVERWLPAELHLPVNCNDDRPCWYGTNDPPSPGGGLAAAVALLAPVPKRQSRLIARLLATAKGSPSRNGWRERRGAKGGARWHSPPA